MAPLAFAGVIMQGASQFQQASAANKASRATRKIGEFNAAVSLQDAELSRQAYRFEQQRVVEEGERSAGTMRTMAASSGANLDVGAPLMAEAELAKEMDINQLMVAYEGENAARRLENKATINRMGANIQADLYRAQGTAYAMAGMSTLLGGAAKMGKDYG